MKVKQQQQDEVKNVDLISTLMEMRDGKVAVQASEKFNELIAAIMDTGKPGKIIVSLKVSPSRSDLHEGVKEVRIDHDVKIDKPERTLGPSAFFVTPDGRLSRTDPDQMDMFEGEKNV